MTRKNLLQGGMLIVSLCILHSCATIFNGKNQTFHLTTDVPTTKTINNDVMHNGSYSKDTSITVVRSREPLTITVQDATNSKTVTIPSRLSIAYYSNVLTYYGLFLGFVIDHNRPEKYAYPSKVYISLHDSSYDYLRYIPLPARYDKKNILKVAPLKGIGMSNPSLGLAYERIHSRQWSTQIAASYLLPSLYYGDTVSTYKNTYGFRLGAEQRFYFYSSAPQGWYAAFEVEYLYKNNRRWLTFVHDNQSQLVANMFHQLVDMNKQFIDLSGKVGYQYVKKRLTIDLYGGLGVRYRKLQYLGNFQRAQYFPFTEPIGFTDLYREGRTTVVDIPLGIRVGYTF